MRLTILEKIRMERKAESERVKTERANKVVSNMHDKYFLKHQFQKVQHVK